MDVLINQTATAIERAAMLDANGDETVDIIRVRRILRDFQARVLDDEPKLHIDPKTPKRYYYSQAQMDIARAEALREAADRAVEWMNKDHYFDPPEPFDNLRAAIMADEEEKPQ